LLNASEHGFNRRIVGKCEALCEDGDRIDPWPNARGVQR
jgi:hypothetical protein